MLGGSNEVRAFREDTYLEDALQCVTDGMGERNAGHAEAVVGEPAALPLTFQCGLDSLDRRSLQPLVAGEPRHAQHRPSA